MNDAVIRVVYEVSFKDTFNYNIFQILYYSIKIYMVQKLKKNCHSNFYCPQVAYDSAFLNNLIFCYQSVFCNGQKHNKKKSGILLPIIVDFVDGTQICNWYGVTWPIHKN